MRFKAVGKATNKDGRNLWSIVGLAHDPEEGKRKYVNEEIKNTFKALAQHKFMQAILQNLADKNIIAPKGLPNHSTVARGTRLRVEDRMGYEARSRSP